MKSSVRPLSISLLLLLMLMLASSVVKATLNLTLQYELREDRPPGFVVGNDCSSLTHKPVRVSLNVLALFLSL